MKYLIILSAILFSACAESTLRGANQTLGENLWQLNAISGQPMATSEMASIRFDDKEKRVSGKAFCNSFFGQYEATADKIRFSGVGATKMYCEGKMEQEQQFLSGLQRANRFELDQDTLRLYAGDSLLLSFKR